MSHRALRASESRGEAGVVNLPPRCIATAVRRAQERSSSLLRNPRLTIQDKIATVTDPNSNTTSYSYSGFGENTQTISPDTGTTTQTFNPAGSVLTKPDARGKTATYTYDVLSRLTQVSYLDGNTTHTYDVAANGVGQLASVTDPSGSTSFTYTTAPSAWQVNSTWS